MMVNETITHSSSSKRLVFTRWGNLYAFLAPMKTAFHTPSKPIIVTINSGHMIIESLGSIPIRLGNTTLADKSGLGCLQEFSTADRGSKALLPPRAPFQRRRL